MKNNKQKGILIVIAFIILASQSYAAYIGGYKEIRYSGDLLLNASNTLDIAVNGTSKLYIANNGDIGFGTTSPAESLDIQGAIKIGSTAATNSGAIRFLNDIFQGYNGSDWLTLSGGSVSGTAGWTDDGSDVRLTTLSDNVGIGTLTPGQKLTVIGNANITGKIYANNFSGDSDFIFMNNTDDIKMIIKDSGNVGIGTASPTTKLDVAGTINASAITVNGINVGLHSGISGENITSGTVADARIADTIARDSEVYSLIDNNTIIRNYNETWLTKVLENTTIVRNYDKIGNTSSEIWTVVDNETFARITDLSTLIDNTTIIRSYDKIGNTTAEIRAQFSGSDNISVNNGIISINKSFVLSTEKLGNTTSEIWSVVDNETFARLTGFNAENITGGTLANARLFLDDSAVPDNITIASTHTINTTGGLNVTGGAYFGGNVGIGTTMPNATLSVNGIIQTIPRSSATCDLKKEGGIYYDSDDNHFYGCNSSDWIKLDTTYS